MAFSALSLEFLLALSLEFLLDCHRNGVAGLAAPLE
jgi:hypothetical protein|tara:strand:- start:2479 stop:2586 length:108 start_codon:yes stop_codon:yes gene_type:complete